MSAAMALGVIPADVALPDFRELALWFHTMPGDSTAVSQAKVRCIICFNMPLSFISIAAKDTRRKTTVRRTSANTRASYRPVYGVSDVFNWYQMSG